MEEYAQRGVFRGFSRQPTRDGVLAFKMTWHRELVFDLEVNPGRKTISIPRVLPHVPADIYADFKEFVKAHHEESLPDHRRIETAKVRVRCANHSGRVSLAMVVKDGDFEYALQRLIQIRVHGVLFNRDDSACQRIRRLLCRLRLFGSVDGDGHRQSDFQGIGLELFRVEADEGRIVSVIVAEGKVEVRSRGTPALVPAGGDWHAAPQVTMCTFPSTISSAPSAQAGDALAGVLVATRKTCSRNCQTVGVPRQSRGLPSG